MGGISGKKKNTENVQNYAVILSGYVGLHKKNAGEKSQKSLLFAFMQGHRANLVRNTGSKCPKTAQADQNGPKIAQIMAQNYSKMNQMTQNGSKVNQIKTLSQIGLK